MESEVGQARLSISASFRLVEGGLPFSLLSSRWQDHMGVNRLSLDTLGMND